MVDFPGAGSVTPPSPRPSCQDAGGYPPRSHPGSAPFSSPLPPAPAFPERRSDLRRNLLKTL